MRKQKMQARHFNRRARERIGVVLDQPTLHKEIQSGKAEFVERQSHRLTVWRVERFGKFWRVVYDKKRKQVVTIFQDHEQAT